MNTHQSPDYEEIDGNHPDKASLAKPIVMNGRPYFPAREFFALTHGEGDAPCTQIAMLIGNGLAGLAQPLSPESARMVARALLRCADKVEAIAADATAAALARAAGK